MVARVIDHPFGTGVIPTPYNPDPTLLAIVEIIREGLIRDQHVRLHNFGTFRLRWSKERRIKHPKTGASITVAPVPRVTFTPAKHLREMIEPDKKPSIPLDDHPISNSPQTQEEIRKIKPDSSVENYPLEKNQVDNELPNLAETVQDIIDENFRPPAESIGNFHFQQENRNENRKKPNYKWALGLLAAVPLILTLLQADFTADKKPPVNSSETTEFNKGVNRAERESGPIRSISRTEQNVLDTEKNGSGNRIDSSTKSTVSASPVTTSKPFYMSPQLHTIQTGENLWKLAEHFYGDALLWPHIFRANARTLTEPDKIISGKQIVIPGLQQQPDNLSGKDRQLVAEGYYKVYLINRSKHSQQAIYFLIGAKQYSFEWLMKMKPAIPRQDWDVIERNR